MLGLGRHGQQLYRYVFDTDLDETIRTCIRYDAHVHDLRFHNKKKLDFNNKVNVLG